MIMPSVTEESGPVFGMPELAPTALFLGLFLVSVRPLGAYLSHDLAPTG